MEAGAGRSWRRLPDLMLWNFVRRMVAERRLKRIGAAYGAAVGDDAVVRVELLEGIAHLLEIRNPYTYGHCRRVAGHAERMARAMHLSAAQVAEIRTAALVHDVGKVYTPTEILHKEGPLNDEEFEIVKRHAADGADMLAPVRDPELAAIVRHHHERVDGSGIPTGSRARDPARRRGHRGRRHLRRDHLAPALPACAQSARGAGRARSRARAAARRAGGGRLHAHYSPRARSPRSRSRARSRRAPFSSCPTASWAAPPLPACCPRSAPRASSRSLPTHATNGPRRRPPPGGRRAAGRVPRRARSSGRHAGPGATAPAGGRLGVRTAPERRAALRLPRPALAAPAAQTQGATGSSSTGSGSAPGGGQSGPTLPGGSVETPAVGVPTPPGVPRSKSRR